MHRPCLSLALLASCFHVGVSAQAQTSPAAAAPPDTVQVLAKADITARADARTPVTYLNLPAAELEARSYGQEPAALLSETPSFTYYSDGGLSNGYAYYRLRGIDQTRVNVSLDGMPLNEPEDQGAYFSNYVDLLNSASAVQIQRGVGTTQVGVASYAGSIQLSGPEASAPRRTEVGAGYGSYGTYRAYVEHHTGLDRGRSLYARVSQLGSDGYTERSRNVSTSALLSGNLVGRRSVWRATAMVGRQANQLAWIGVSDSLLRRNRRVNANGAEDDRFVQAFGQVRNTLRLNPRSTLQSSVYGTVLDGGYDFDLNNFIGLESTPEMYRYDFRSGLVGAAVNHRLTRGSLALTTGLHANTYRRRHLGSERSAGELYRNTGHKWEGAAFAKTTYALGAVELFADVQVRHVAFDYRGSVALETLDWTFVNPKLGASAQLREGLVAYYSIGATGREPTRNDIFLGNDDLPADDLGRAITGSTRAERVVDQELGLRLRRDRLRLDVNAYYMAFANEIVLNGQFGPNGLALTDGVEDSYRAGLELTVDYRPPGRWRLINNSALNRSRIREGGVTFAPVLTPALIVNQELRYRVGALEASLLLRYQGESYLDFANAVVLDGYALVNARFAYNFGALRATLFVNNLLGADVRNHGYVDFDGTAKYFAQAPAHVFASLSYRL